MAYGSEIRVATFSDGDFSPRSYADNAAWEAYVRDHGLDVEVSTFEEWGPVGRSVKQPLTRFVCSGHE